MASSKDLVDNLAQPDHLQRLKVLDFLIRRLQPVPFGRLVVVIQHHGINRRLDHPMAHQLEPPPKHVIEDRAEASPGHPVKGFEKTVHRMRRGNLGVGRLQSGRIPQVIEIPQMTACAVKEETEELLEEGLKREVLTAFAERAKGILQERGNLDLREVADEEG